MYPLKVYYVRHFRHLL